VGEYCDPEVRFQALQLLKEILHEQRLLDSTPNVTRMLSSYQDKPRDIVLIVDTSSDMTVHKDNLLNYLTRVFLLDNKNKDIR